MSAQAPDGPDRLMGVHHHTPVLQDHEAANQPSLPQPREQAHPAWPICIPQPHEDRHDSCHQHAKTHRLVTQSEHAPLCGHVIVITVQAAARGWGGRATLAAAHDAQTNQGDDHCHRDQNTPPQHHGPRRPRYPWQGAEHSHARHACCSDGPRASDIQCVFPFPRGKMRRIGVPFLFLHLDKGGGKLGAHHGLQALVRIIGTERIQ